MRAASAEASSSPEGLEQDLKMEKLPMEHPEVKLGSNWDQTGIKLATPFGVEQSSLWEMGVSMDTNNALWFRE